MKSYKIISASKEVTKDASFWASKTPTERVAAVEVLREQWMKMNPGCVKEFQRVVRIVDLRKD